MCSTPAREMRSASAFKVMNKLLGTCPALVSMGVAPPKAVVGVKLPLKMRTSLLCPLLVLNQCQTDQSPATQSYPYLQTCHRISVGHGHAVVTSQVVSGEVSLPAESSAGSTTLS